MGLVKVSAVRRQSSVVAAFAVNARQRIPKAQDSSKQFGRKTRLLQTLSPELADAQSCLAGDMIKGYLSMPQPHPRQGLLRWSVAMTIRKVFGKNLNAALRTVSVTQPITQNPGTLSPQVVQRRMLISDSICRDSNVQSPHTRVKADADELLSRNGCEIFEPRHGSDDLEG